MSKGKSATLSVITDKEAFGDFAGAKHTIREIVKGYKLAFEDEYLAVVKSIRDNRTLMNDEFGSVGTNASAQGLQRVLFEIPERVHSAIVKMLTDDELLWFKTGTPLNKNEGGQWFAKTFPEFRVAEKY